MLYQIPPTITFTGIDQYTKLEDLKRERLFELKWPIDKINLCCCWVETGGYHCVLLVETDKGWFILDNRYSWPMTPKSLPYEWDKIERGGKWFELSF